MRSMWGLCWENTIELSCSEHWRGGGVCVDAQKSAGNTSDSIKHPRNLIREIRTSMVQLHAAVVLTEQEVQRVFKGIMVLVSHQLSS